MVSTVMKTPGCHYEFIYCEHSTDVFASRPAVTLSGLALRDSKCSLRPYESWCLFKHSGSNLNTHEQS